MVVANGSTEAFIHYHKFHEQFNSRVQVTLAGMLMFRKFVGGVRGVNRLDRWVQSSGMPWPPHPRTQHPTKVVDKVIANLGQMAVVEAVSAFDWFTLDYVAVLAQFSPDSRTSGPFNHAHTPVICDHNNPIDYCVCCRACAVQFCDNHKLHQRVESICAGLNIHQSDSSNLLPLFHYFRLARNCIVHASGRASKDFVVHSQSTGLSDSLSYWNSITRKPSPGLPAPPAGDIIPLTMAHAVLASGVCHRIAKAIDGQAGMWLGVEGFVHMAAFYSLFSAQHGYRRSHHDRPESAVSLFLSRYRIKNVNNSEIRTIARRMGIWGDIVKRAKAIYPKMKL